MIHTPPYPLNDSFSIPSIQWFIFYSIHSMIHTPLHPLNHSFSISSTQWFILPSIHLMIHSSHHSFKESVFTPPVHSTIFHSINSRGSFFISSSPKSHQLHSSNNTHPQPHRFTPNCTSHRCIQISQLLHFHQQIKFFSPSLTGEQPFLVNRKATMGPRAAGAPASK